MNRTPLPALALALVASLASAPASARCHHHCATKPAPAKPQAAVSPTAASGDAIANPDQPPPPASIAFTRAFAIKVKPGMHINEVAVLVGQAGNDMPMSMPPAARSVFWMGSANSNFEVDLDEEDKVRGWNLIDKNGKSWGMNEQGKIAGPY